MYQELLQISSHALYIDALVIKRDQTPALIKLTIYWRNKEFQTCK